MGQLEGYVEQSFAKRMVSSINVSEIVIKHWHSEHAPEQFSQIFCVNLPRAKRILETMT